MKINGEICYGLAFFSLSLISACSNNVPACSDPQASDLVLEITNNEVKKNYGKDIANGISLSLGAIRTTDKNEKTGAFNCAAELSINEYSFPITYTVEVTDDNQTYVTVYGL